MTKSADHRFTSRSRRFPSETVPVRCSGSRRSRRAFTLIEMVVVLTILTIVLSGAFSGIRLMQHEIPTEGAVNEFLSLAQEMRARALSEQRPYQIVFEEGQCYGLRYYHPYSEDMPVWEYIHLREEEASRARDTIAREMVERPSVMQESPVINAFQAEVDGETSLSTAPRGESEASPSAADDERGRFFVRELAWPEGSSCEVLFWGEVEWTPIEGGITRRWVFQPSGMCDAIKVRFRIGKAWAEVAFDPMTGELSSERHGIE